MPQSLSTPPEELVRQFLVDNINSSNIEGYDPTQTDQTASDFLPITNSWSRWGDHYPIIVVQETDGPILPNSGNTNYNSIQGDGSGPNQLSIRPITVGCQAVEGSDVSGVYRNSTTADTLVQSLYAECQRVVQDNQAIDLQSSGLRLLGMTPPTQTRNTEETDSGSTLEWIQRQGTVNTQFTDTP